MFKKIINISLALVLIASSMLLAGCSNNRYGITGGAVNGIVHEGVYESCGSGNSASSEGKVTTIDGVELKLPVDWGYATRHQQNFHGNNWEGDDAARGIGIFNCNEEGDNSQEFADSYSVNIRWEYCGYGSKAGGYPTHVNYKGVDSSGQFEVGGTDETCVSGGGIINQTVDNKQYNPTSKAKVIVYNPETGKACVCAPGFNALGNGNTNCNWGGAPLALMGGITTKVSSTIGAKQNKSVLELYFADPDTPLGPCEFNGGSVKSSKSSSRCNDSFVDASSMANLAVSAAYDKQNPSFAGHEMVTNHVSGSNGSSVCPTTELARKIRNIATKGADDHSADCGYFVASVVILTVDDKYVTGGTSSQSAHCDSASSDWEVVMSGVTTSAAYARYGELKPGDIFICPSHTFMFVGNEAVKAQFDYADSSIDMVGASQDEHGPYLQSLKNSGDSRSYTVYRFKGDPHPLEGAKEAIGAIR